MPCDCKRHTETDITKKLKEYMLSTLSSRGKNGLQEIADNFNCIFICAYNSSREERFKAYNLGGSMNFGFDEEVRSLLIQKLVLYNDVTDDQSDLKKSLVAMILMIDMHSSDEWQYYDCKMSSESVEYESTTSVSDEKIESTTSVSDEKIESTTSDSDEKIESSTSDSDEKIEDNESFEFYYDSLPSIGNSIECFNETDINRLIDLWSSTSNDHILKLLAELIVELSANKLYSSLFLSSNVFLRSCTDLRRYLALQYDFIDEWFRGRIFNYVISEVPDFLSIMFKSASYLVNCWRLLNTADMTVEMLWIEKCLIDLTKLLDSHISQTCLHKDDGPVAMEIARFFRCITYAIVKTHSPTNHHLRKLLLEHFTNQLYVDDPDIFLLFKYELNDVNEDSVDSSSSKSKYLIRNGELKLQPLSREDANHFELPQHVNDALKAFPDTNLLHDPEIGCYSILQVNRHRISTVEWLNEVIGEIRRASHKIDDKEDDLKRDLEIEKRMKDIVED